MKLLEAIHAPAMTRPEAALLPAELPEREKMPQMDAHALRRGSMAGMAVLRAPGVRLPGVGSVRNDRGCK